LDVQARSERCWNSSTPVSSNPPTRRMLPVTQACQVIRIRPLPSRRSHRFSLRSQRPPKADRAEVRARARVKVKVKVKARVRDKDKAKAKARAKA